MIKIDARHVGKRSRSTSESKWQSEIDVEARGER